MIQEIFTTHRLPLREPVQIDTINSIFETAPKMEKNATLFQIRIKTTNKPLHHKRVERVSVGKPQSSKCIFFAGNKV